VVQIDLFTLGAQIINFLVLVLLLRHFLYGRVVRTMEERETLIASRLEESERKKKEAEQEAESYREKKQELLSGREEILAQAKEETERWREELMKKARIEVEDSSTRWYEEIERQKSTFLIDLRRRSGERICAIARRVLLDLANDELERQMINTFIKRMQSMGEDEKKAIGAFNKGIVIKSAFEIPEIMSKMVLETVRDQIGGDVSVQFEIEPELVCGIELHTPERQITWSLRSYLDELEKDISRALEQRSPV